MGKMLRDRRLVHEKPAGREDTRDLVHGGERTSGPTAHVIAGAEVDHHVEAAVAEWQRANVRFHDARIQSPVSHAARGNVHQSWIDIHANKLARHQPP